MSSPVSGQQGFAVWGTPVGQPRATPVNRGGRSWMIEAPSSHPIHAWKKAVLSVARFQERFSEGVPLQLELTFIFQRPQRLLNKGNVNRLNIPHTSKPDCDNLAKAIQDCLNELLWHDDRQIVDLHVTKRYANAGEGAGVTVRMGEVIIN